MQKKPISVSCLLLLLEKLFLISPYARMWDIIKDFRDKHRALKCAMNVGTVQKKKGINGKIEVSEDSFA